MKFLKINLYLIIFIVFFTSCSHKYYVRKDFKYPKPVNTSDKQINYQNKKIFRIGNIYIDNSFDGARMNGVEKINDSLYMVTIEPENYPINDSPWFSFNMRSDSVRKIFLKLNYVHGHHRYIPKISYDRKKWEQIDVSKLFVADDKSYAIFPVKLDTNKLWISAEEIVNSEDVNNWLVNLENQGLIYDFKSIGKSKLGKDINYFRIGKGKSNYKDVIVVLSRQHPPEVSGFLAMKSFVEELLKRNHLTSAFYEKYDIWVFPLLNPDGVDLGHWRHNANGVDLNRDWAYYRQPEVDAVTNFIVKQAKTGNNRIVLSIDFHSTQKDVYYTFNDSFKTGLHDFVKNWLSSIDMLIYPFPSIYSPEPLTKPYSKVWFYRQFRAESLTYEVGDETPRAIIDRKARIAAVTMMDLLIK